MKKKKLKQALEACRSALSKLVESLRLLSAETSDQKYGVFLDACIKRYEVLFEYTWRALKIAIEYEGREAPGPRPAIQEAARFGWIKDLEFWALALDARNDSVHDYFGMSQEEYLKVIERFAEELQGLLKSLSEVE